MPAVVIVPVDLLPLAPRVPDQLLLDGDELALQDVGLLVALQVIVALFPVTIVAGLSVRDSVGAFGITSITTLS